MIDGWIESLMVFVLNLDSPGRGKRPFALWARICRRYLPLNISFSRDGLRPSSCHFVYAMFLMCDEVRWLSIIMLDRFGCKSWLKLYFTETVFCRKLLKEETWIHDKNCRRAKCVNLEDRKIRGRGDQK